MATDLTGLFVADTYRSLLKIGDNSTLTGDPDRISDGYGNESILYLSTSQVSIGSLPATGYDLTVNSGIRAGSIDILGAATTQTLQFTGGSGTQGTLSWNTDEETVDIIQNGATLQVGQEIHVHVKNQTGSTISDGTPVYVTGTLGASGRLTVAPMIADGSIEAKYFLGVTTEDIPNGEDGKVTTFGKIRGLDTTAYTEGQTLYVSSTTAGFWQTTPPVSPALDLEAAIVISSHANNGTIFVRAQQGYYLGMLHDVYVSTPGNNDILSYNSTIGRWENKAISGISSINLDTVTDNGNTTTNSISVGDINAGNVTLTGYLRGAANFVIDPAAHGDETGTVQILGNLIVEGETTTINSTTVTIDDKNLVLASGASNATAWDGAGITIDGANATMTYNSTSDRFVFNKDIETNLVGDVTGNLTGNVTGNADTATTWETARTITIGDTGKTVDGSSDVSWSKTEIGFDLQDVTDNGASTDNTITLSGSGSDRLYLNVNGSAATTDQNAIRYLADNVLKAQVGIAIDPNRILADTNADDFVIKSWGDIRFGGGVIGTTTVIIDSETGDIGTVGDINADGDLNVDGTITGATARFTATSGHAFGDTVGTSRVVSFLNSALAVDSVMYLTIGREEAQNNQAEISFRYVGDNSASNQLRLGLYGDPDMVTIDGNGHLSVTSGNLAVDTGVIKIGANTVIDSSRNSYFATTKSNYFFTDLNTTVSGVAAKDWIYLGSGARGAGAIINDKDGARYSIQTGGYDLTFAKHISSSDTWSNVMRFESLGVDTDADVRILNDLTIDGSLFVSGTIDLSDANLDIGSADIIFGIDATDTGARGLVWNFDADGDTIASNIGYIRAGGTLVGEKMQFNMNADGTITGSGSIYEFKNGGTDVVTIGADGNINTSGGLEVSGTATFDNVAVFNGQVNYNSEDRSTYWSYDNKVAAVFKPAADDGAVAILFPSIGNSVSDFGYIAFDEDYGEAGVAAGENSALIIGCENDGGGSSDHVRVKGRLVVEADMSSSDPTNAFQVKSSNVTTDLFRVARSGASVFSSTLNVADQLTVDDAIRLTSNPTITGDSSGVYFWNQAGVGATIASNAFEVRTNGNTTAFSIDNSQVATIHNELRTNGNILVGGNSSLRHPALDRFVNVQSTTNGAIIGYNLAVIDGANNRRGSFFMDDSAGVYGIDHTYSSGSMDFVIRVAGGELMRVLSNGNFGLGNSSPTAYSGYKVLHIGNGSTGGQGLIKFGTAVTADGGEIYCGSDGKMRLNTNGSTNVAILSGSNFGIGVDPTYKLQVAGQAHIQGILSVSTGQQIRIGGSSDGNHFLRKIATGYSGVTIDGPQLQGHQGGELTTNYTGDNWALRWATGGNVYINNNLGIGIATASHRLHIDSNSNSTYPTGWRAGELRVANDNASNVPYQTANIVLSATGWAGGTTGVAQLSVIQDGSNVSNGTFTIKVRQNGTHYEAFRIKYDGSVGIGTTSPTSKLQVQGDIRIDGTGNKLLFDTAGAASTGRIQTINDFELAMFTQRGAAGFVVAGNSSIRLGFGLNQSAGETDLFISQGGLVGIGTTSPSEKLQVNGWIRLATNTGIKFDTSGSGGDPSFQVGSDVAFSWKNTANTETMRLENGGNVGIGTTSPNAKLDVNGTVLLGREHGVTQLHNNKDYNNMASGLVWREYNATGTYAHATSSVSLSDYIKAYNFTEQGIASTVDSFTRSDDTYAVEFVGYYYANTSGTYQFSASSDDSSDFFIDGTRVAYWYGGHGDNNAPTGGTGQVAGSIYLVQGFHRLYARFQEGTGGDSISLWHNINGGGWAKISSDRLYHKADDLFRATGSGNATLYGTFTATADIVAYSDERIKDNIETIDNALDKVNQLRGVSFNRKSDGKESIGVIAQEVEKILPEVVTEDDKGIKGVSYGNIVGVLIEAMKEQQKQIDELKARLDA